MHNTKRQKHQKQRRCRLLLLNTSLSLNIIFFSFLLLLTLILITQPAISSSVQTQNDEQRTKLDLVESQKFSSPVDSKVLTLINNKDSDTTLPTSSLDDVSWPFAQRMLRHSLTVSLLYLIAYSSVFLVGLLGNVCVVLVVLRSPRMRNATNFFICNLALADILVLICCLPATLIGNLFVPWLLGLFMCKAVSYLQGVAVSASINTLVAVSIERYLAICYPLKGQMSRSCAKRWICLIWLLSFTIALPWAYYFQLQSHSSYQGTTESTTIDANEQRSSSRLAESNDNFSWSSSTPVFNPESTSFEQTGIDYDPNNLPDYEVCVEIWPNEASERTYFVFANLILCYLLPLLLISACYIAIWLKVWRRSVPGETGSRAFKSLSTTPKTARVISHRSISGQNSDQTQSDSNGLTSNASNVLPQKSSRWRKFWIPHWRLWNRSSQMNEKSNIQQMPNRQRSAEINGIHCAGNIPNESYLAGSGRLGRLVCGEPEISSTSLDYSEQSLQLLQHPLPPRPPPTPVSVEDQRDNVTLSTAATTIEQHALPQITLPVLHSTAPPALLKRYLSSEQLTSSYTRRLFYNEPVTTTNGSVRSIKQLSTKLCNNALPSPVYPQNGLRILSSNTTPETILKNVDENSTISLTGVTPKKIHSAGNLLSVDASLTGNKWIGNSSIAVGNRSTNVSTSQLSPMKKFAYSIARAGTFWRPPPADRLSGTCCPTNLNCSTQNKSLVTNASAADLLCGSTSAQLGLKMELILQRSKLKVAKMMIVVVLIFFLSWLPLYFVFTKLKLGLQFTSFQNAEEHFTILMAPFAQWLGASNSCVNPLLYAYFNSKYKKEFANLLAKLRSTSCGKWIRRQTGAADPSRRPTTPLQPQPLSECSLRTTRASINRLGQAAQLQRFGDEINVNDRMRTNTLATTNGKFV